MAALGQLHTLPLTDLHTFHRNPRKGNIDAIAASLRANGQYRPIVVNRGTHTGRPMEVLGGNHTLMAHRQLTEDGATGYDHIDTYIIDVDDTTAARIVLADNRTADLGTYDEEALLELLQEQDDLAGTGYDEDDLELLRNIAEDAPDLPDDTPYDTDDDPDGEEVEESAALRVWGDTTGEPDVLPDPHSVWKLGRHILIVADLHTQWQEWVDYLDEGTILYPYPTLLAPWANRLEKRRALFIQPSAFLAGWLITKWNRVEADTPAYELQDED